MKADKCCVIMKALCCIVLTGCATVNPMVDFYENNASEFTAARQDLTGPHAMKMSFSRSYEDVWESALFILAQQDIIIDVSREQGTLSYVSIDGVHFGDVFPEDTYLYWEFPYTVFITGEKQTVTVFVYPMRELYDEKDRRKSWWKIIDTGFQQKSEDFLKKLLTQLTVQERWQWFRKQDHIPKSYYERRDATAEGARGNEKGTGNE